MNLHRECAGLGRIATDVCALPADMLQCLLGVAARSLSPIAVTLEHGRSLQVRGRFKVAGSTPARFDFALDRLVCLGRTELFELRPSAQPDQRDSAPADGNLSKFVSRGIPIYCSGVRLAGGGTSGIVESVVVVLPRTTPPQGSWGRKDVAERTLRTLWARQDVGAQWPLRRGRQMWYGSSLVHGLFDGESWQPVWVFSSVAGLENLFDVVVGSEGGHD